MADLTKEQIKAELARRGIDVAALEANPSSGENAFERVNITQKPLQAPAKNNIANSYFTAQQELAKKQEELTKKYYDALPPNMQTPENLAQAQQAASLELAPFIEKVKYYENQAKQNNIDLTAPVSAAEAPQEVQANMAKQAEAAALNPEVEDIFTKAKYTTLNKKKAPEIESSDVFEYKGQPLDVSKFTVITKAEKTDAGKKAKAAGSLLTEIDEIDSLVKALEEHSKGDVVSPVSQVGIARGPANLYNDALAAMGAPHYEKERVLRKDLEAALTNFSLAAERAIKGGNVPENMRKALEAKGAMPSVNEGFELMRQKLHRMKRAAKLNYAAEQATHSTGRLVTAPEIEKLIIDKAIEQYDKEFPQFKDVAREKKIKFLEERDKLL